MQPAMSKCLSALSVVHMGKYRDTRPILIGINARLLGSESIHEDVVYMRLSALSGVHMCNGGQHPTLLWVQHWTLYFAASLGCTRENTVGWVRRDSSISQMAWVAYCSLHIASQWALHLTLTRGRAILQGACEEGDIS